MLPNQQVSLNVSGMRIEIWADMVCAWAYIGKRRLEKALASPDGRSATEGGRRPAEAGRPASRAGGGHSQVRDGEPVEVVWRPFRMDPSAPVPATPRAELLRDPLADAALRACAPGLTPSENLVRISEVAAAEGLGPTWGAAWRSDSHDAHRLLFLAERHGGAVLQDAVAEGVLRAYFVEGLDLGRSDVLAQVASEAGFEGAGALLAGGAGDREVKELVLVGRARGIGTSPTIVVNGQALAGAQSPETIAAFLRDAGELTVRELPAEIERFRQSESLMDQRDPLGALTLLEPLRAEHGDDRNVVMLAARAYFASAQLGKARAALEGLVESDPSDSYARLLLGRTLHRQGLADEAATHLRLAETMTPDYA
jgi:predicted DsbA family dithiol-disulfide isomerase